MKCNKARVDSKAMKEFLGLKSVQLTEVYHTI